MFTMNYNISGWKRQQYDPRDVPYIPPVIRGLNTTSDLSALIPELDQGDLGSCGPNSVAELIYADLLLKGTPSYIPSRLFIYWWTRQLMNTITEDSGVDNRTMLTALHRYGYINELEYPYDVSKFAVHPPKKLFQEAKTYRIQNYKAIVQQLDIMKACIDISKRPFIFGFDVFPSMMTDDVAITGTVSMPKPTETAIGGHDVTFCGYNDRTERFLFKNHWRNSDGTWWGKNGFGTIPYAYAVSRMASDFWCINGVV